MMWLVVRRDKNGGNPLVCCAGLDVDKMREARKRRLAKWPYDHESEKAAEKFAADMNKEFHKKFTYNVEHCRTLKDALKMGYRFAQRKGAKK